ncbi:hypothetical protein GN956_G22967 [Arapaima gigas]
MSGGGGSGDRACSIHKGWCKGGAQLSFILYRELRQCGVLSPRVRLQTWVCLPGHCGTSAGERQERIPTCEGLLRLLLFLLVV